MLVDFFLDLDPDDLALLGAWDVLVFDLNGIHALGEVGVFSSNVDHIPDLEFTAGEFDDAYA